MEQAPGELFRRVYKDLSESAALSAAMKQSVSGRRVDVSESPTTPASQHARTHSRSRLSLRDGASVGVGSQPACDDVLCFRAYKPFPDTGAWRYCEGRGWVYETTMGLAKADTVFHRQRLPSRSPTAGRCPCRRIVTSGTLSPIDFYTKILKFTPKVRPATPVFR